MNIRWLVAAIVVVLLVGGTAIAMLKRKPHAITLRGTVIADESDPVEQSPIGGATVSVEDNLATASAISTFSGYFSVQLLPTVIAGQLVTLQARHPQYSPTTVEVPAGDQLYVIRLSSARTASPPPLERPHIELSNVTVRYMVEASTATNIGSGVKMFEVANTGNVPCESHGPSPCSPDGKWKAAVGGVSLDAGPDNEFRNARLSCIAGPCPFTQVDADRFSSGGRLISALVRNWSDTTTFVLEAEVIHPEMTVMSQRTYPTILGRRLNFSLPAAAQGLSIEAEIGGEDIVFPLGPTASVDWATCEVRSERERTRMFRCELKPQYEFKK